MRITAIVSLASTLLLCNSCLEITEAPIQPVRSDLETSRIDLSENITGVLLNVPGIVYLTPARVQRILVTTKKRAGRRLSTQVSDGVWVVEFTRPIEDLQDFVVYIETPNIRFLELNGSGEIRMMEPFEGDRMHMRLDGSGTIEAAITTDYLLAELTGIGKMELTGKAEELKVNFPGAGSIEAFALEVGKANINVPISATGLVEVNVTDSLRVDLVGPASVRYKGGPIIEQNITGEGTLSSAN